MQLGNGGVAVKRERATVRLRQLLGQFDERGGFLFGGDAALEVWAQIQDTLRTLGRLDQAS